MAITATYCALSDLSQTYHSIEQTFHTPHFNGVKPCALVHTGLLAASVAH